MRIPPRFARPALIAALAAGALAVPGTAAAAPVRSDHCQWLARAIYKNMLAANESALAGDWTWFDHFASQASIAALNYSISGC